MTPVKHQPATPLPWRTSPARPAEVQQKSGVFTIGAANAYPKLVDALLDARAGMLRALNPVGGDAKCAEALRIDALLRNLGEVAAR